MKNIFKGKLKFIILLILVILGLVYYFTHRNSKEKVYVHDYSYIQVEKTDDIGTLNLNGSIKANNPIGIFVDKKLKVKEVFIKNGDFVQKGQVLMTFDDDETNKLNRNIEKERINLQKIQRDLKTTRELQKLGGASRNEVKNLEDSARVSQLNIDEYSELLNKTATEVRSPVDGVVSNLKAQANYLVDTDTSLLEIIDSNDLRITVEIPEYNSQSVKLGQSIKIRQDISDEDKVYDGEIVKISRLSTASSLTSENVLEADVKTNETIPNLVPGFKIKGVLQLKADEKNIIIPKIALQSENGKYFVFTIDNKNTVKRKEVTVKNIVGDNIIITSGLNVGETLIVTPDNRLYDGLILTEGSDPDNPMPQGEELSVPADEAVVVEDK
ncbi:efflux RND transporter periplasmic adaptor subunit [Fusobacterium simiae]|uniref:Efflux RND transporter periplasmic adaptor subunit n=1 Tax=Fusobacterium simiae TaxID=855 RepID=A0ABT4DFD8_FUSSI|nr:MULTISPECIES: efflux RND transporter periplasmic adaptor subunit [Fusobacterium]MCY7007312.1 efflux RND transporter periplasmic adaptor subunit [Fusobacterium simiae]